jgi:hypothetical protein
MSVVHQVGVGPVCRTGSGPARQAGPTSKGQVPSAGRDLVRLGKPDLRQRAPGPVCRTGSGAARQAGPTSKGQVPFAGRDLVRLGKPDLLQRARSRLPDGIWSGSASRTYFKEGHYRNVHWAAVPRHRRTERAAHSATATFAAGVRESQVKLPIYALECWLWNFQAD